MDKTPQLKDLMYELLKEPSREKFRELIMFNTGEKNNIDFKSEWIDKVSLSKLMLSLGNSGGGVIVFGIKENEDGTTEPIGIAKLQDNAVLDDMIKKFIPTTLKYQLYNFAFDKSDYEKLQDKKFQVIYVIDTPEALPFVSLAETTNLQKDTIYIRRGTKCEKAKAEELEKIINRRIETQYSSSSTLNLEEHLSQLEILYAKVKRTQRVLVEKGELTQLSKMFQAFGTILNNSNDKYEYVDNLAYPAEDYEQFIVRVIKIKKVKIEKILDIK